MIKGIIFDMDGLIFDTETIYYQASQEVADNLGLPYDEDYYDKYIGVSDSDLHEAYHKRYDKEFGSALVDEFISKSYQKVEELFIRGMVAKKPGLDQLLDYLNENNIKKALATSNSRFLVNLLLEKNNLVQDFQSVVSAEDVQFAKPNPEIFELALEKLGLKKDEVLILEDSKNGILAAQKAGIKALMIPDRIPKEAVDYDLAGVLTSLEEVIDFLKKNN
jgi:haloacid dehalogenase superfamily, subfamily IA, variant 3 with third motif having DD or ED/haloacid dehalogenase superfamily, subfamily IA, variant 1 with third motif having Dx(3-4)D or Dx(3-4)E